MLRNTKFLKVSILDKGVGVNGSEIQFSTQFQSQLLLQIFSSETVTTLEDKVEPGFVLSTKSCNPDKIQFLFDFKTREKDKTGEQEEVAVPGCDTSKEKLLFLTKPPALPDESVIQPDVSYLMEAKLPSCCCKHISYLEPLDFL